LPVRSRIVTVCGTPNATRRRSALDDRPLPRKSAREERRARRLAEREADRERTRRRAARPAWQDPTALITGAALVVGLLLFVLLVVRPFSSAALPANVAPTTSDNPYGLVKPTFTIPAAMADGRTLGRVDAPVTMDVWADFQCPYCGQFARTVEPQVITNFVVKGVVRLVAHDFTFLGTGHDPDESVDAAVAARCADRQGRFWDYYMTLFWNQGASENGGAFTRPRLLAMADLLGLDHAAFQTCLDDQSVRAAVIAEKAQGVAAGVSGTPTSFINGTPVQGFKEYPTIAALISAGAPSASPAQSGAGTSPSSSAGPSSSP
jgi:protein-disulfide isomerase